MGLSSIHRRVLAEATTSLETEQAANRNLQTLEVDERFDRIKPCRVTLEIDSEGSGGGANPLTWGAFESVNNPHGSAMLPPSSSKLAETPHPPVPITGDWQPLTARRADPLWQQQRPTH